MVTRMATLPRPPTLREIVMHSLLGREPADTLVDADDERPTEIPAPARDTLVSVVFDLGLPRPQAESSP